MGRRKKNVDLILRCKALTDQAIETLLAIMEGTEGIGMRATDKIKCAELILAYGWGKPTTKVTYDAKKLASMSDDELRSVVSEALEVMSTGSPAHQ